MSRHRPRPSAASRRLRPALATVLLCTAPGGIVDLPDRHAADGLWRIVDLGGAEYVAHIVGGDADALQLDGDDVPERLALDEIADLRPVDGARQVRPLPTASARVWLRSGASLPVELTGTDGDGSEFRLRAVTGGEGEPFELPAVRLQGLLLAPDDQADSGFSEALLAPPTTDDLLFAVDPRRDRITRLSVQVIGLRGDRLAVTFRGKEQTLPLERVHGVVFGRDNGIAATPVARPRLVATLADGDRLTGALESWDDAALHLRLAEGPVIALPHDRIAALRVESSRVAWLDGLEPTAAQHTPAFDRPQPWMANRTPAGSGLQLAGRWFDRGLCLIPRSALTFAVEPGAFDIFEATIGIDDRAGPLGHAVFRVRLDGEVIAEFADLVAGQPPRSLRVALGQARELTLETDFGPGYDLGDHVALAAARLLRTRDS